MNPFHVLSVQGLEARAFSKAVWTPFIIHNARDAFVTLRHHSPCVYHLSAWCQCMWPGLPGLPLHICMLQAIKYWRWKWPGNDYFYIPWISLGAWLQVRPWQIMFIPLFSGFSHIMLQVVLLFPILFSIFSLFCNYLWNFTTHHWQNQHYMHHVVTLVLINAHYKPQDHTHISVVSPEVYIGIT